MQEQRREGEPRQASGNVGKLSRQDVISFLLTHLDPTVDAWGRYFVERVQSGALESPAGAIRQLREFRERTKAEGRPLPDSSRVALQIWKEAVRRACEPLRVATSVADLTQLMAAKAEFKSGEPKPATYPILPEQRRYLERVAASALDQMVGRHQPSRIIEFFRKLRVSEVVSDEWRARSGRRTCEALVLDLVQYHEERHGAWWGVDGIHDTVQRCLTGLRELRMARYKDESLPFRQEDFEPLEQFADTAIANLLRHQARDPSATRCLSTVQTCMNTARECGFPQVARWILEGEPLKRFIAEVQERLAPRRGDGWFGVGRTRAEERAQFVRALAELR